MWEKRVATETSNTVERLTAAGMIPLGKLHMVEFAFGGWGTNPLMGTPWNPWDLETDARPAARRAAPASPSRRGSRPPASAATPAARCAFPAPSTGWSASRSRSAASACTARCCCLDAGLDRSDGALGRGLRPDAQRPGRSRSARSDDARPAARGFRRLDQRRLDQGHAHRPARRLRPARMRSRRDRGLAGFGEEAKNSVPSSSP